MTAVTVLPRIRARASSSSDPSSAYSSRSSTYPGMNGGRNWSVGLCPHRSAMLSRSSASAAARRTSGSENAGRLALKAKKPIEWTHGVAYVGRRASAALSPPYFSATGPWG